MAEILAGGIDSAPDDAEHPSLYIINRPRIVALLSLGASSKLTFVVASAGYGKSTAVAQFMQTQERSVIWLSLQMESNNPAIFLALLWEGMQALDSIESDINEASSVFRLLPHIERLTQKFGSVRLVLDDYHIIESSDIHEILETLIVATPPEFYILISSRSVPPLSIARLRASGQVCEIGDSDLKFTFEETSDVAALLREARLSPGQLEILTSRSGGWIASIRLALLSLRQSGGVLLDEQIESLASDRWLHDYLIEEVLDQFSDALRDFVLRTAALGFLEESLCNVALEIDNSADFIEELVRRLALSRSGSLRDNAFAYHHLFAECVQRIASQRLPRQELLDIRKRAAVYFEEGGRLELALTHALGADDIAMAVRLAVQLDRSLSYYSQRDSSRYWISRLPEDAILSEPRLAFRYVYTNQITGNRDNARRILARATNEWDVAGSQPRATRAYLALMHACAAEYDGARDAIQAFYYQALHGLPKDEVIVRAFIWSMLVAYAYRKGDDELGAEFMRQTRHCLNHVTEGAPFWRWFMAYVEGDIAALRGDLMTAAEVLEKEIDFFSPDLRNQLRLHRSRLASVYLEWNALERALEQDELIWHDLDRLPWMYWHPQVWIKSAEIARAAGDDERAQAILWQTIKVSEERSLEEFAFNARAVQASWRLEEGRIAAASRWLESLPSGAHRWMRAYGDVNTHFVAIQHQIAIENLEQAKAATGDLMTIAELQLRHSERLGLLLYDATIKWRLGERSEARESLRTAITIGNPGKFHRSFLLPFVDVIEGLRDIAPDLPRNELAYITSIFPSLDASGAAENAAAIIGANGSATLA